MDNQNLLSNQQALHDEASTVIETLDLNNLLAKFGTVHIVGSYTLDLMTWRDIDISITSPDPDETEYWEIVKKLLTQPEIIDLNLQDTRQSKDPDLTAGLYIGARYTNQIFTDKWDQIKNGKKNGWKIDLWFVDPSQDSAIKNTTEIKAKLTPEKQLAILKIKNEIADLPSYRKTIFSIDIYDAVLNHDVITKEDFETFLKSQGRSL